MKHTNKTFAIVALIVIVIMVIAPLYMRAGAEFGGADGEAESVITEISPDYQPWFSPLIEPASGEIESMLFSLQAAFGSAIIFYGIGYLKGKHVKTATNE